MKRNHVVVSVFVLLAASDGTLVKLIHSGLANEDVARKDYSPGRLGVLESLKKFAE